MLGNLEGPVVIDVFLKGDFPAGFKKLANGVQEFLQEVKEYSKGKVQVIFSNPLENLNDSSAAYLMDSLQGVYDISRYTLQAPSKAGDELTQ